MTFEQQMAIVKKHQVEPPVPVVEIARELGVECYRIPNMPDGLSGMLRKVPSDPSRFGIYVNARHSRTRQRFTIAHEIAHFMLHLDIIGDGVVDDALYRSGLSNPVEAQANRLAADILMPWHLINPLVDKNYTMRDLAKTFDVSESAMAIRLGVPYDEPQGGAEGGEAQGVRA